jgi:hypothetical protein
VGNAGFLVRSSTQETDRLLRAVFAPYVSKDNGNDDSLAGEYAVRVGVTMDQPARQRNIHYLYERGRLVARSRRPSRIVWALAARVAENVAPPDGLLASSALALVSDRTALVVPRSLLRSLNILQPLVERNGLRVLDRPEILLDPYARELVVLPVPMSLDPAALEQLDETFACSQREPAPPAPGRYRLRAWAVVPDDDRPVSRAFAVSTAVSTVRPVVPAQQALTEVAEILAATPVVALRRGRHADVARQLVEMAA